MTVFKNRSRIAKTLRLSPLLLLAACGTMDPSYRSTGGRVQEMAYGLQEAICQGQAQEALDGLLAEPLVSAADRFYTALALEESGAAQRARMIYAGIMQTGSDDIVRARCPDRVLADGPVRDEAARRLAALSELLAMMDVNFAPERALHEGIARSGPVRVVDPPRFPTNLAGGPPRTVARPASQSPLGQWFVHLASYRSIDSAMKNRSTLETKFPSLAGIIDQWELDVGGSPAVRLGVRMSAREDATRLCNAVKSQQEYCAVIDTSQ